MSTVQVPFKLCASLCISRVYDDFLILAPSRCFHEEARTYIMLLPHRRRARVSSLAYLSFQPRTVISHPLEFSMSIRCKQERSGAVQRGLTLPVHRRTMERAGILGRSDWGFDVLIFTACLVTQQHRFDNRGSCPTDLHQTFRSFFLLSYISKRDSFRREEHVTSFAETSSLDGGNTSPAEARSTP
jgi:hypothetical protein